MKVGIAISSYNSDDDVIALVKKIDSESWPINGILIVDSIGSGRINDYFINNKVNNLQYINFDLNLGSASNLNKRLLLSAERDWDFVLTLNHDALVTKETFLRLMQYSHIPNIGALYPLKYFPSKNFYDYSGTKEIGPWRSFGVTSPIKNQLIPCLWSSSNGALYNLNPIKKGIAPNSDLWMGWEDYLYGLDLEKSGYKQFLVSNAVCEDNYEFTEKSIGFTNVILSSKPDWYHYYRTRNLWLICLNYHPSVLRFLRVFLRTIVETILICFGWKQISRRHSLKLQLQGFFDAWNYIIGEKDI